MNATDTERDVERLPWAARQLGVSEPTAYRLAQAGKLPGAFKAGNQWRISVPRFRAEVHGSSLSN
jgi:excisionase family DNA binding protein